MTTDENRQRQLTLIGRFDTSWIPLRAALDAADPDESLHDPENPRWVSRDVYTHVTRWLALSLEGIRARLDGRDFTYPNEADTDVINARWQAEDAHFTLEEARLEAERVREDAKTLLSSLRPEQWDSFIFSAARGNGPNYWDVHH